MPHARRATACELLEILSRNFGADVYLWYLIFGLFSVEFHKKSNSMLGSKCSYQ
jgi:hypothetical protein